MVTRLPAFLYIGSAKSSCAPAPWPVTPAGWRCGLGVLQHRGGNAPALPGLHHFLRAVRC